MVLGLGAALRREASGFVDDQRRVILVDHHAQREFHFVFGQIAALAHRARAGGCRRISRRHAQRLPRQQPITRRRALAVNAQLPRTRPTRHDVERCIGQMPFKPTVKANAIIIRGDDELPNAFFVLLTHVQIVLASIIPAKTAPNANITETAA